MALGSFKGAGNKGPVGGIAAVAPSPSKPKPRVTAPPTLGGAPAPASSNLSNTKLTSPQGLAGDDELSTVLKVLLGQ